jgi:hypothetical protein
MKRNKSTLDTKPLQAIARKLVSLKIQIEQMVPVVFDAIEAVEKSHRNIVAAHKAHLTMAKQGKGISPQRTQRSQRKAND